VGQDPASKFFRQNNICMTTTLAEESLRAQLDSQCKLTMPMYENQKIRQENELLKAKELTPDV
jgi:hypothetical protein